MKKLIMIIIIMNKSQETMVFQTDSDLYFYPDSG